MDTVHGLDISHFNPSFLEKSIKDRLDIIFLNTISDYCQYLAINPGEAAEFYNSLYITYSEFFRNPLTYAMLEQLVLPRLIEQRENAGTGEIRVWSAACAKGQEGYSIAILLDDLISSGKTPVSYRIFATDRSEDGLAYGREGMYDSMAIQNVRMKQINTYFESYNHTWSISHKLKERIEFSSYDLLDEHSVCPPGSIFGDFDLIFCCNLLFYYQPDSQQFILEKISKTLTEGGYLASGEIERAIIEKSGLFTEVCSPSAIYRKRTLRG
ncbi:MAG TPA: CheR family methyltransferase [Methanospirillum sp.]|nr:CheR family methyltransferase [Methanospirillum sp.]